MANQVKEQFESNSQQEKRKDGRQQVVANQVKEQFESNSQQKAGENKVPVSCGEPS